MNVRQIAALLNAEILWCQANPTESKSVDFQNGFIAGLKQAKFLINNAVQQQREADDLSVCLCPADGMPNAFCPLHGTVASGHGLR